jgi:hypothetical protein
MWQRTQSLRLVMLCLRTSSDSFPWQNHCFGRAKRAMYVGLRHKQLVFSGC